MSNDFSLARPPYSTVIHYTVLLYSDFSEIGRFAILLSIPEFTFLLLRSCGVPCRIRAFVGYC